MDNEPRARPSQIDSRPPSMSLVVQQRSPAHSTKSDHPHPRIPRIRVPPTNNLTPIRTTRALKHPTRPTTSREDRRKVPLRTSPALSTHPRRRCQTRAFTPPHYAGAQRRTHGGQFQARGHGFPARGVERVARDPAADAFVVAYGEGTLRLQLWCVLLLRKAGAAGCAC